MRRRRITIAVVRAGVMLALGSAAVFQELFLRGDPNLIKVYVGLGLMLGPAVIEAWWRARNPMPAEMPPHESSSPSALR